MDLKKVTFQFLFKIHTSEAPTRAGELSAQLTEGENTGGARSATERGATNNAGPAFRPTPQRDPIFRDAKVLLFWCDQQQKELLVRYFPFVVTVRG